MSYRRSINSAVRVAVGASLLVAAQAQALAQQATEASAEDEELEVLEDVVVTARNRVGSAQDIPIPITVLGAEKLETFGILWALVIVFGALR